ncbi:hypothetical protein TrVFT333_004214 [Trichoderma virens FT-333]|nr:hypothetical protein TrVFT333_004214 [Trichoderma virens FT-333]
MPPPSTHVFTFGLNATHATEALENLILEHLERAARKVRLNVGDLFSAPCPAEPQDVAALVTEMGDYLARTALIWSALIQSLIQGPHIDQVTLQILEKSRVDTGVADITASVSMDVTLSRLRKMRDLAEQYSRDVQAVWRVGGRRSSLASLNCTSTEPPTAEVVKGCGEEGSRSKAITNINTDGPNADAGIDHGVRITTNASATRKPSFCRNTSVGRNGNWRKSW